MTKQSFNNLVELLRKEGYHVWADISTGWAYISYKQYRKKISVGMTDEFAQRQLWDVQPILKVKN